MRKAHASRQYPGVAAKSLLGDVVPQTRSPLLSTCGGLDFPEDRVRRKMEVAGLLRSGR